MVAARPETKQLHQLQRVSWSPNSATVNQMSQQCYTVYTECPTGLVIDLYESLTTTTYSPQIFI
jgi:hypothetical protein